MTRRTGKEKRISQRDEANVLASMSCLAGSESHQVIKATMTIMAQSRRIPEAIISWRRTGGMPMLVLMPT